MLIIPTVLGASVGAWVSTVTPPDVLRNVFAGVFLLVAASVLLRPSRWLEEREAALHEPWRSIVFFGIGFYGGLRSGGVGFILLAGLVLGAGLNLVNGNAAKVVLIAAYSPIAILLFARASQVDLAVGAVLAVGQCLVHGRIEACGLERSAVDPLGARGCGAGCGRPPGAWIGLGPVPNDRSCVVQ